MVHYCDSPMPRRQGPPSVITFVRKLNGASQPSIVMTTGAKLWVLKCRNFGGPNALLNEVVGTELMAQMGLPVPDWSPVLVTDEFIDRHPESWLQRSEVTSFRPESGLHFASRLTLSRDGLPTYQVIPKSWHCRVTNREDFVGALAADLWTNNCDRRQCLFLSTGRSLHARFIDHDNLFGGIRGNEKTSPRRIMMPSPELFAEALKKRVVSRWKKVIDRISEASIDRIFEQLPFEWADASTALRIRSQLSARRYRLESLLDEAVEFLRGAGAGCKVSARSAPEPRMSIRSTAFLRE